MTYVTNFVDIVLIIFSIPVDIVGSPLDKREVEKRHQNRIQIENKMFTREDKIDEYE